MKINPISFGQKTPLTKCHIRDNVNNKFVPATFYEIDCECENEIDEVKKSIEGWRFSGAILQNMQKEHDKVQNSINFNNKTFYEMETDDKEVVGICQIRKFPPELILEYIETKGDEKYKYVGQTMMASLGNVARHENLKKIYIPVPLLTARSFYVDKCGFKRASGNGLAMKTGASYDMQKKTEAKVNHPIIDLMV